MLIKLWLRRSNFQEKRAKFKHIEKKSIQERKMRGAQIPLRTSLKKGLAASGRRRDMMGAWCGASSSLDLRDRGRTGVLAPSAPENVLSEAGVQRTYVRVDPRSSIDASTCRRSERVDVSMFPTRAAHLSLTACRGSVTTSFTSRTSEVRRSSHESASRCWPTRRHRVHDDASWRQFSGVATTY